MASIRKWFASTAPGVGHGTKTTGTSGGDYTPRPACERAMALLDRLQYVHGDLLGIYANEYDTQPVFVQEGLLRVVFRGSRWFERTMEYLPANRLVLNVQRDVLAIFLYFVFYTRVPGLHEVGHYPSIPSQYDEDDYHTLLVLTWVFAESVELPALQNALMLKLFEGFDQPAKDLTMETLQICLIVSESGTKMRSALLEYALWWELQNKSGDYDDEHTPPPQLQPYMKLEEIKSIGPDLKEARALWNIRGSQVDGESRQRRPSAKSFLVPDHA